MRGRCSLSTPRQGDVDEPCRLAPRSSGRATMKMRLIDELRILSPTGSLWGRPVDGGFTFIDSLPR